MATLIAERKIDLASFPFIMSSKAAYSSNGIVYSYDGTAKTGMQADLILTSKAIKIAGKTNVKLVRVRVAKHYNLESIELSDYTYNILRYATLVSETFSCKVYINDMLIREITEKGTGVNELPVYASDAVVAAIDNAEYIELKLELLTNVELEFDVSVRLQYEQYYIDTITLSGSDTAEDTDPSQYKFTI